MNRKPAIGDRVRLRFAIETMDGDRFKRGEEMRICRVLVDRRNPKRYLLMPTRPVPFTVGCLVGRDKFRVIPR